MIYFSLGEGLNYSSGYLSQTTFSAAQLEWYRDTMMFGEVAFWEETKSIIIGTGISKIQIPQGGKSRSIKLITKCHIIGRVASPGYAELGEKYEQIGSDAALKHLVTIHERRVKITIADTNILATLLETRTADLIYRNLPINATISTFGENCIFFETSVQTSLESNTR